MRSIEQLQDYPLLLIAGVPQKLTKAGTHFFIQKASDDVTVKFDNADKIVRRQGQGHTIANGYENVEVSSLVTQSILITLGDGTTIDSNATINAANLNATIENANTNTELPVVSCAPGVRTLLAPGNTTRKALRLAIDSEQSGGVFLGGASIVAGSGGFLDIGMIDYLTTEGALYAFNSNAEAVEVSILQLERI